MDVVAYFLSGFLAILFSVLAWRLRSNVFFILGVICTSIVLLIAIFSFKYIGRMLKNQDFFYLLFFASLLGLPVFFLIKSKLPTENNSLDGSSASGAVTPEYLDEIINAPDEEIDFEDGLNN